MLSPERESAKEIFSQKEKAEIINRIFVTKEIDSSFLYKGNGSDFFNKILKSPLYPLYKVEIDFLIENQKRLLKHLGENITDIGCGNGDKVIALLKGQSIGDPESKFPKYTACDYSSHMIGLAEHNINTQLPQLKFGNHQILRDGNTLFTNVLNKNTYLWLGTIGDYSKPKIIENLRSMNNNGILQGNNIMLTYFTTPQNNQAIEQAGDMYENEVSKEFMFNGLENAGVDTSYFDYIAEYNHKENCVYIGIQAKEDYVIILPSQEVIRVRAGEKCFIHKSQRFAYDEVKELVKKSGGKIKDHIVGNGIELVVVRQNPKYLRKIAMSAGITAGLVAATLGGYYYAGHKQQSEKQELQSKIIKDELKDKHAYLGYSFAPIEKRDSAQLVIDVEGATSNLYHRFLDVYGIGKANEQDLETLEALMKNELLQSDTSRNLYNLNKMIENLEHPEYYANMFLRDDFLPRYKSLLARMGFNITPYEELQEHTSAFENTANLKGNLRIMFAPGPTSVLNIQEDTDNVLKSREEKGEPYTSTAMSGKKYKDYNILRTYNTMYYGNEYVVLEIIVDQDGKNVP